MRPTDSWNFTDSSDVTVQLDAAGILAGVARLQKALECPCGPTDPALMVWCGFPKGFTMHDWCSKFNPRNLDGTRACSCPRHAKP